ncbi:MerR family transcriptional regulator [Paenibacillus tarimensis]|uniref:MerR family transcriptional regulator n=1 Tax=Paenibacillus tarimensis TaxID=416012 RepID=UPI001F231E36|nr:MerR family transcriptional regulator [Paenibacillus tarimensis]MCF2943232.1 MerR family transcriptional regulator [Paenibacillus tarimensis]
MGDTKLYRIGELAKKAELSPRTIDFYTKLGLITPTKRSDNNYRLYGDETLERLARIEQMKKEKYTLDEIKAVLDQWGKVSEEQVNRKLTDLEIRLTQLQREVQELEPVIDRLKPQQARNVYKRLMPQTAACIEALMLLIGKGPLM